MNEMTFYKFFKEWFTKHIFNVNIVNPDKSLEKKLTDLSKAVEKLPGMAVTVLNQKDFNTKSVEDKLSNVISALKELPQPDNGNVVDAIKGLSHALDKIKKVEVTNQKEIKLPKEMNVSGEVKVSNFPKEQKVSGEVKLSDLKELIGGFQAVVDTLNDLKLNMAQDMKNMGGVIVAGQTGGRAGGSGGGDASAANQTTIIGHINGVESSLSSILSTLQGTLTVSASIDTTGLATSAGQNTIIGHVDGIETVLGTIDTDTGAIATSVASIDTKTPALGQALAAASVPVVLTAAQVTTLTPPAAITGFATSAKQDTIISHVDGVETLLTTVAGAVSGTEVQVDVLTMPTTTVQATDLDIRNLTATDIVTVADIKDGAGDSVMDATNNAVKVNVVAGGAGDGSILDGVSSAIKATVLDYTNSNPLAVRLTDTSGDYIAAGAGTQYTEGDTDASITGTATLVEGAGDALAVLTQPLTDTQLRAADVKITLDGESVPVTNAGITTIAGAVSGTEMQVDVVSSALPTGASTLAEQQSQTTHLATIAGDTTNIETAVQLIDDTVYTDGTGTVTKGIAVLGQDGTNPQAIKTDANGELQVDVLTMPTVAVTQSGTWDEVGINDSGNSITIDYNGSAISTTNPLPIQPPLAGYLSVAIDQTGNNNAVDVLTIAAGDNNIGNVDVVTVPADPFGANADAAATAGSTGSMQAKFRLMTSQLDSIKTAVETLDNTVGGTELQVDIVGALPAGTNAIGKLSANSGVDIGDVDVTSLPALAAGTNAIGKLLPPDIDVTAHTNYARKYYTSAGAATDGIIWSPAAGKRWHVVTMYIQTSAAATITLEDDKAGGDDPVWKGELAANSGVVLSFTEKYPMASGEDAADLLITTSAGNVYVTCVGYEV